MATIEQGMQTGATRCRRRCRFWLIWLVTAIAVPSLTGCSALDQAAPDSTTPTFAAGATFVPMAVANAGATPTTTAADLARVEPSASPVAPTTTTARGAIRHVVVIWMENREATTVTSTSMPYLFGLSRSYGRADRYFAIRHPSLPNYLAFWAGSTEGVTNDGTYNFTGRSISNQMAAAGLSWRTYAQDYPTTTGCHTGTTYAGGVDGWGVAGTYVRRHDPAMSFTYV